MTRILLIAFGVPLLLVVAIVGFVMATHVDNSFSPPPCKTIATPTSGENVRAAIERREKSLISEERRTEFNALFRDVARAFREERHEQLEAWRRTLPDRVKDIPNAVFVDDLFNTYNRPFHDALFKEFVWRESGILSEFRTKEELDRYLKTSFAAVRLLCDMYEKRKSYLGPFGMLEANVLTKMKCYRKRFGDSGRNDLSEVIDKSISQWMEQIESTNGYTRISTRYYVELMAKDWRRKYERELNGDTRTWTESLKSAIEVGAKSLIDSGYSPHWIEEFKTIRNPDE